MSVDQTITFWNQSAQRILGHSAETVLGRRCYEVVAGLAPGGLTPACLHGCPSIRRIQAGVLPEPLTMQMRCASGQRKLVSLTPLVVSDKDFSAPLLVHLFSDGPEPGSAKQIADSIRSDLRGLGADIVSDQPGSDPAPESSVRLSKRQLEVLRLVALGWDTPRIAEELGISTHTALNHIRHFRQKLNASTKLEAVVTAMRLGILDRM